MTKYDEIMNRIELTPDARERIISSVADRMGEPGDETIKVKVDTDRLRKARIRKDITAAACLVLLVAGTYGASRTDIFREYIFDMGGSDSAMEIAEEEPAAAAEDETAQEDEMIVNNSKSAELTEDGDAGAPAEDADEEPESSFGEEEGSLMDDSDRDAKGSAGIYWDMQEYESREEMEDALGFSMGCEALKKLNEEKGMTEVTYRIIDGNIGEIEFSDGSNSNYYRRSIGEADISGDYNEYKVMAEFDGVTTSGSFKGDKEGRYQLAVWTSSDGFTYAAYLSDGVDTSDWYEIIADCTGEVE